MESTWIQDALRSSIKTIDTFGSPDSPPPEQDPLRRKLIEGVLFTRRFVPTYHILVLGIIFIVSGTHWVNIAIRRNRRRAARLISLDIEDDYDRDAKAGQLCPYLGKYCERESSSISSSGSSTLQGTASPPQADREESEETPLLHDGHILQPVHAQKTILSSIRKFLMYQPRSIPVFNKTLPPNGTSLAILGFMGINIFYMFFHIDLQIYQSFVVADRFGFLFVANLPYLYLLAAKNQPAKLLTGRSYESLNLFHRRLGELLCLQAILHCGGMVITWYLIIRPNGFGLVRFLLLKTIIWGLIAFFAYEALYFTSLASFRQRWYELFLGLHIVLQVIALVFVFLHHPVGQPYVGASLAIFLLDRLVYRIRIKSTTVQARAMIMEDDETVKLTANIPLDTSNHVSHIFGKSISYGWKATDHIFVTVPSLSGSHILQSHPFTIASRAPASKEEEAPLILLIRAQSGFSADLLMRARSHKQLTLRLDGPYGSSHARHIFEGSNLALLIAGGSGIAVCWPLVQHLLDRSRASDVETGSRVMGRRQRIVLIWIIHQGEHLDWIGREALADAEFRGVEIIIPRATEEIGRPDLKGMIESVASDTEHSQSTILDKARTRKISVVASGPDSMGRVVQNTCAEMVGEGKNVDVTIEKFGW
ncbi:hypothetical protein BGZ60DRAFT_393650 [Tricladium varicosporioides]|nr:hypothetical protein BGZ60DRAFT_393650 [Hymenoscyphus varicosporioides]